MKKFTFITWLLISTLIHGQNLQHGLVGYYTFTQGSLADQHNSLDWVSSSAVPTTTDIFNQSQGALNLQAANSLPTISFPGASQIPNGSSSRSYSLWFKLNQIPASGSNNYQFLFFHGRSQPNQGFGLALGNHDMIIIGYLNDIHSQFSFPLQQWNHLAVTYDGTTASLYLNGNFVVSNNINYNTANAAIRMGFLSQGSSGYINKFRGALDEFRIYNRALTNAEIQLLSNTSTTSIREQKIRNSSFQIFPNPAAESLFLQSDEAVNSHDIQFVNQMGQKVKVHFHKISSKLFQLDLSTIENGIYYLRLADKSHKVLVQH